MKYYDRGVALLTAVVLSPVDLIEREHCLVDNWVWDETSKSPEVLLSSDSEAAYFFIDPVNESRGTAGTFLSSSSAFSRQDSDSD